MRIFICELKKLWNLKILLVVAALGALTYLAFLSSMIISYNSIESHGIYGSYQREMFDAYGKSLTPEEYADFNVEEKIAEQIELLDDIIAGEPLFANYGVENYADWEEFERTMHDRYATVRPDGTIVVGDDIDKLSSIVYSYGEGGYDSVDDMFTSPYGRLASLQSLRQNYQPEESRDPSEHGVDATMYLKDNRPVVLKQVEAFLAETDKSLIRYDLTRTFSQYSAETAVFSVLAGLVLIAPFITTDRLRRMHYLHYSSKVGRRIFGIQLLAATATALLVGTATIAVAFGAFFAQTDAAAFMDCSIRLVGATGVAMYDITFGQFVLVCAGMILALCVAASCFALVLGRFSSSVVAMMLKTVPVATALAALGVIALADAFNANNLLFTNAFNNGRIEYVEPIVCGTVMVAGVLLATVIIRREQKVDVA
jgi:hypothetical protein